MKIINWLLIIVIAITTLFCYIPPQIKVAATSDDYLNFESISTKQGLSHNSISAIIQDHYGYMWIGTSLGLNKYDGVNFYIYKHDSTITDSISSSNITAIYETEENELWIGTTWGLNKYNRKTDTFVSYLNDKDNSNTLSSNSITEIYKDDGGTLWIGTNAGLYIYNQGTDNFTLYKNEFNDKNYIIDNYVTSIYQDCKANLWVGTIDGLYIFNINTNEFTKYLNNPDDDNSLSDNHVTEIYEDSRGIVWIGTATGINIYNSEDKKFTSYLNDSHNTQDTGSEYITSICEDNNGYLWIGTRLGLKRLNVENMDFCTYVPDSENPNSLNTDRITAVCKDFEGSMWIGSYYGINKITFSKQVIKYYYSSILNNNAVSNIRSLNGIDLWLKTRLGPIKFDSETYSIIESHPNIFINQNYSNSRMNSFCISTDGCLWAGTEGYGLEKFNPTTGELTTYKYSIGDLNCISSNTIISLYANLAGTVWVGTSEGLCKYDVETNSFIQYKYLAEFPDDIKTGEIWLLYESNDYLWVGTKKCLYGFNYYSDEVNFIIDNENFGGINPNNIVCSLFEDSHGVLWIVTNNGLFCYDIKNREFILHGLEDLLVKYLIRDVIEDNNGNIWISTGGDGLWRLSGNEKTYTKFGIDDGLQSDVFLFRSSYKTENGELFFGTIIGLISFLPQDMANDTNIPIVLINKFNLLEGTISFDEPIENIKEVILSHSENSFEINFVALSYDYPEFNKYAYMLEGFDKSWNYCSASTSFTKYTNIPSGKYTFKVIASNSDDTWNYEGVSLEIIITPPFWKEWWFILTIIVAALLAVMGAIKLRTYTLSRYAETLESQVEERTSELAQKNKHIEEQMNNKMRYTRALVHELKTPLTPLLASSDFLCSELEDKIPLRFAKNIKNGALNLSKRIDELLDMAKSETGMLDIKPELMDIKILIESVIEYIEPEISKKTLTINSIISPDISDIYADEERLKQVLLNLLDNAIKYTPAGGTISIMANRKNSGICIQIKDTGMGMDENEIEHLFKPYHRIETGLIRTGGLGLGLFISKTIIDLHGGNISVSSKKGVGTTFVVWLPVELAT
jgi:signal transduction histidine kinase/ligand-binding sensor domain-containing protein